MRIIPVSLTLAPYLAAPLNASVARALALIAALSCFALATPPAHAQKNFDTPPQLSPTPQPAPAPSRPSGPATTAPRENNTRFTLINNSDMVIDSLNISPVTEENWGDDLLGTLSLPGHSRLIAGPAQNTGCMFDVRVVYHDHREELLRRQNLCDLEQITFTGRNARLPRRRSQSDD